ncbi:hypothetical protein ACHAWF_009688 [Thalassiosira exigua]
MPSSFKVSLDDAPTGARRSKRLRRSKSLDDEGGKSGGNDEEGGPLVLPPEVWASVLEFLPFASVLSCAAVSRGMLRDVVPRLTTLRIDKSSQMNLTVASRFRDLKEIRINSLLKVTVDYFDGDSSIEDVSLDIETKIMVVPFLSRFSRTLERVSFGAKNAAGKDMENFSLAAAHIWDEADDIYPNESPSESIMAFIDMISGAFQCGAFPKRLKLSGLCCPRTCNALRGDQCSTCTRACKSFPLESVLRFENRGTSLSNARSGRSYGLDVCLPMAQVESIIESRPGGKELLRSEHRLLRLLGSGRRWEIKSGDGGRALYISKYDQDELAEMKRVIAYADLDVTKLSEKMVQEAISKSFLKDGLSMPPRSQRYLSGASLAHLKDELGLRFDEAAINASLTNLVEYAQPIASVLQMSRRFDDDDHFWQ